MFDLSRGQKVFWRTKSFLQKKKRSKALLLIAVPVIAGLMAIATIAAILALTYWLVARAFGKKPAFHFRMASSGAQDFFRKGGFQQNMMRFREEPRVVLDIPAKSRPVD